MILFIILILMLTLYIILALKKGRQDVINVYFGVPGSGKTTFAAYLTKKDLKRGRNVWSNVPITGAFEMDCKRDIGKHMFAVVDEKTGEQKVGGSLIIDEAGIEYNNRSYKTLDPDAIKFFKYHRHYETSIDVFSQSHEDMDVTLRRLAQNYFAVKKSLIPNFIVCKAIGRRIGIDTNTKQIIDEYFWKPFGTKWIYSRPLWKMFNTTSREELPSYEWVKW